MDRRPSYCLERFLSGCFPTFPLTLALVLHTTNFLQHVTDRPNAPQGHTS